MTACERCERIATEALRRGGWARYQGARSEQIGWRYHFRTIEREAQGVLVALGMSPTEADERIAAESEALTARLRASQAVAS